MIDQKISESFRLVFVAIDLFVEVDDVGFGVGEDAGVVFPDVAVVLVVLVVVDVFCFYFLFPALDYAEVDQSFLFWFDYAEVVVIAAIVVVGFSAFCGLVDLVEIDVFADAAFDIL